MSIHLPLSLASILLCAFGPAHASILDGAHSSFAVQSVVKAVYYDVDVTHEIELREVYSIEQRRAKLWFTSRLSSGAKRQTPDLASTFKYDNGLPARGHFVHDLDTHATLQFDEKTQKCTRTDVAQVAKMLHVQHLQQLDSMRADTTRDAATLASLLIGPTQLLLFVESHANRLGMPKATLGVRVRNVPCLYFKLDWTTQTTMIVVHVYYSEAALARDKKAPPMQIVLELHDYSLSIVYDYLEPTPLSSASSSVASGWEFSDDYAHDDELMIAPLRGCSAQLKPDELVNPFENLRAFAFRTDYAQPYLSFDSARESTVSRRLPVARAFVAYDARLATMRIDTQRLAQVSAKTSPAINSLVGAANSARQLIDLDAGRIMHVLERPSAAADNMAPDARVLRRALETQLDGSDDGATQQCQVLRVSKYGELAHNPTVCYLLTGARKLAYLGRARVRGIEARLYETPVVYPQDAEQQSPGQVARTRAVPLWYAQPLQYTSMNSGNEPLARLSGRPVNEDKARSVYSTLVYVAADARNTLLAVHMVKLSTATRQVLSRIEANVHEFTGDLSAVRAPNGDGARELFALTASACSSSSSSLGNTAQLRLTLEEALLGGESQLDSQDLSALAHAESRDLALLAAMQAHLFVPASLVYEIRSNMRETANNKAARLLTVSLRVAERPMTSAKLMYIGQGRPNLVGYAGSVASLLVFSFKECYVLAAHRRATIHFSFDPKMGFCLIDLEPAREPNKPQAYVMGEPAASAEVYLVQHAPEPQPALRPVKLDQQLTVLGRQLPLLLASDHERKFVVARATMHDESAGAAQRGELGASINGYGFTQDNLRKDPRRFKLIYPKRLESGERPMLTRAQCEAQFLADFACRSYSVCVRAGLELECIASEYDLRASDIEAKFVASNSKVCAIDTKQGKVELTRHANCELHHKDYLRVFEPPRGVMQSYANRRVYGVSSANECAEMCYRRSVHVMERDAQLLSQWTEVLAGSSEWLLDSAQLESHAAELELLHSAGVEQAPASLRICKTFLYMSAANIHMQLGAAFASQVEAAMRRRILRDDKAGEEAPHEGYCMLNTHLSEHEQAELQAAAVGDNKHADDDAATKYLMMSAYQFDARALFEPEYGVRLRASKLDGDEYRAYRALAASRQTPSGGSQSQQAAFQAASGVEPVSERSFELMRAAIVSRADNMQELIFAWESKCALVCIAQTWGPWPTCRSFDIEIYMSASGAGVRCYLNSRTLAAVRATRRQDLIVDAKQNAVQKVSADDYDAAHKTQLWHFEPHAGLAEDAETRLDERLELASASWLLVQLRRRAHLLRIGAFGALLFALSGIAGGAFIGVWLGARFNASQAHRARASSVASTRGMVHQEEHDKEPRQLVFKNIVDSEGHIMVA